jgi:thiol-disulfide isomerase/thioredoxin
MDVQFSPAGDPPPSPQGRFNGTLAVWLVLAAMAGGVCLYLFYFSWGGPRKEGVLHPAVGRQLPNLRVTALTGGEGEVKLSDLKGKVVLVNYWGTWCGPCREEFPQLVRLERRLANEEDFRLLLVSCSMNPEAEDEKELERNTEEFLRAQQVDLPTYMDPGAASRFALVTGTNLNTFGYPTTVLLDRRGTIRGLWMRYNPEFEQQMEGAIRAALADK